VNYLNSDLVVKPKHTMYLQCKQMQ